MSKGSGLLSRIKKATVAVGYLNIGGSDQPFTIIGSGFCIDPSGIVVTCRHVLDGFMAKPIAKQIAEASGPRTPDGLLPVSPGAVVVPHALFYDTDRSSEHIVVIPVPIRNASAKTDKDLAALQLQQHTSFREGYPFLEIEDYGELQEGDEIGVCGFPLGNSLFEQLGTVTSSFTKGILSSIIPGPNVGLDLLGGFQLNVTATNGNSGGPVFSLASGKVFGVLTLGVVHPAGGIVQGLVKAEPVYPVIDPEFIGRLRQAPEVATSMGR
jgi:S1-C subfamily serine protease